MAVDTTINLPPSDLDLKYTRLHITPLYPNLLPSILPTSVLPLAKNVSYHSLQTFPEKPFAFVDLPRMEAQKIKKKLNGSILKGAKIKIEDARPVKQKPRDEPTTVPSPEAAKDIREISSKKRKRDTETIPAVELQDRKVKRGWTEPVALKKSDRKSKGKKDIVRSKYTSGPECLFRTTLPANVPIPAKDEPIAAHLKIDRRKKKKKAKDLVIHEFSKTTKHVTFIRSSSISATSKVAEYVEGKGWIDDAGNIVEAAVMQPKRPKKSKTEKVERSTGSPVSSKVKEECENKKVTDGAQKESVQWALQAVVEDSTSSSGTPSDEADNTDDDILSSSKSVRDDSSELNERTSLPRGAPSPRIPIALKIDIPNAEATAESIPTVHPLEALFKKPQPDLSAPMAHEAVPTFNFFDDDAEGAESDSDIASAPMTPYTKRDFALRGLRSAAPTPDTAFPGKTYAVWPTSKDYEGKSSGAKMDEDTTLTQEKKFGAGLQQDEAETAAPVSDFQKWFYEHRGESNRAWKKRRKMAAKEKRQRENRKRNERID